MAGKFSTSFRIAAVFVVVIACFTGEQAYSDTIKMNIFERFRNEMAINHDVAAAKFMSPKAHAKWNANIMPHFNKNDRRVSHFFAFSLLIPKLNKADLYVIFFNPWVDGVLATRWRKTGNAWKMEDFYLASGERVRGEITAQSVVSKAAILPVWLKLKGTLLRGIFSYYKVMRDSLARGGADAFMSWFHLGKDERNSDLLRVKLRMDSRVELAVTYILEDSSGPVLSSAFSKLKYDALTKNQRKLAAYSKHADIITLLRPEIIRTFRENWIFRSKNKYSVILSSPISPGYFLFMSIHSTGAIEGVLFADINTMATMLQPAASVMQPTGPVRPVRATNPAGKVNPAKKVQRYKAPNGDQIEVITEKRGSKVIMTTVRNGVVTEVLTF